MNDKKWLYNRSKVSDDWKEAVKEKGWIVAEPYNPKFEEIDTRLQQKGWVGIYRSLRNDK